MEYTTSSENIYFLNDKNIAPGVENACKAGFNAVPSQSAFVEKYGELTGYDDRLCAFIRDDVKVETAALSGEIRGLSAEVYGYVDEKTGETRASCIALGEGLSGLSAEVKSLSDTVAADYVRKSGGSIASVDVSGDLIVGGAISSRYFSTNGIGNTVFSGAEGHGGVKFDFEHGPKDISVDGSGATLDSFVKDEVRTSSDQAIAEAKAYTDEFAVSAKGRFEADESTVVQVSAALDGRVSTAWHAISARIEAVSADIENDLTAGLSGVKSYTDGLIGSLSATADARLSAKVASLSADAKTARTGMMLDMIGQADGVITVGDRAIISDDIPTLPESKVENLVLKYATKQEIVDAQYTKSPQLKIERYESDKNYIYLVDHEHAISSRIDCSDFAKDGMVETVELKDYGEGYLPENGPYLVITWNAAAGKTQTWLPVKKLFNVYKSTDSEGGLSVEGYNIYLNYDVVAKKASVTPLQEYATQLSATGGTIWQLSSHLSALDEQNARQLKMDGHIVHAVDGQALKDLIKLAGDVAIENLVKNNSLFEVRFEEPGLSALSCSFTTSDGFKLGNRDIILVHDCDASKTQIQLDDLNAANVTVIHSGVSRYEFEDELVRRAEDDKYLSGRVDDLYAGTAKLSGGNEISGDNQFVEGTLTISSATVNGVMTVGFGKLVDAATASSLVDISSDITAQVCATSSWLSGQISAEIDDRTKAVKAVREELCAASCLISAWSEAADVALSNTLTGVINTTSTLLSSDLKAHVTNTSNPHGVTAGQINVYLCSQTSSATELDSKFKTLSTYAEIHNTLSSDGYATQAYVKTEDQALSNALTGVINATSAALNTVLTSHTGNTSNPHGVTAGQVNAYLCSQTSSNVQLKNKFDSLSTYADIKAKLSSDGYALTSNTSSVAELNAKFSQYALSNDVSSAGQLKTKFDSLSTYANIKSQLSVDGYALSSQVDKSAKDSIKTALTKAPALNTILTGADSELLDNLDQRQIISVLIDIKKLFASLSA